MIQRLAATAAAGLAGGLVCLMLAVVFVGVVRDLYAAVGEFAEPTPEFDWFVARIAGMLGSIGFGGLYFNKDVLQRDLAEIEAATSTTVHKV